MSFGSTNKKSRPRRIFHAVFTKVPRVAFLLVFLLVAPQFAAAGLLEDLRFHDISVKYDTDMGMGVHATGLFVFLGLGVAAALSMGELKHLRLTGAQGPELRKTKRHAIWRVSMTLILGFMLVAF